MYLRQWPPRLEKTWATHYLGTLLKDAPADIIPMRGNPFPRFKWLEYPDTVISSGQMIVNNFKKNREYN